MATTKNNIIQDVKGKIAKMAMSFISDERLEKWAGEHFQEVKQQLIKDGVLSVSKYEGFDVNLENVSKEAQQKAEDRQAAYRRSTVMMPGGGLKKMESSKGYTSDGGGSNSGERSSAGTGIYEDAPF